MATDANPTAAYDLAVLMRDCVLARFTAVGLPAPDRAIVTVGQIAWDECPCGQLAVTLVEMFPAETFPTFTLRGSIRCPPGLWIAHYTVEMLRCASGSSDTGTPPTPAALASDALLAVKDAHAVRAGVRCCLEVEGAAARIIQFGVGRQLMVGPQGGCVGSDLDVYIALAGCLCPAI